MKSPLNHHKIPMKSPSPKAVRLTDRLRFHHCTDDQAIHTRMLRNDESQRRAVCLTKTLADGLNI